MQHTDLLLTFARPPVPGFAKTRLAPALGAERAAKFYSCMLEDIVERCAFLEGVQQVVAVATAAERLPFFHDRWPEIPLLAQRGKNLGERLENAFADAFAAGSRRVVAIGSDSPDLPLELLREAFQLLREGREVVFGPSEDGGYYLVGLSAPRPELFREIEWSTERVLAQSLERCAAAEIDAALLRQWYDVDRPRDLERPGLRDPENLAPRTRRFLEERATRAR